MTGNTTTQKCQRGHCEEPATVICHIDYPASFTGRAFRWSKPMCDEDVEIERTTARFHRGTVVTTEPLPVPAVTA